MTAAPHLHDTTLTGSADLHHAQALQDLLRDLPQGAALDLSQLDAMDTAGAYVFLERPDLQLTGLAPDHQSLLDTVRSALPDGDPEPRRPRPTLRDGVIGIGKSVAASAGLAADLARYLGMFLAGLGGAIIRPREFRLTALIAHCQAVGLRAVPIVGLMAFLIGVVLAFQGAAQLRQFGAEVFVVDLIAVSILRELGILLTSIIVAGRTASAFTAAIGSMKMREEIDAMRTLGIDPAQALIVPRVLALLLMLPILGLIANLLGLLGGGLMSWIVLDISPAMFMTRLVDSTDIGHIIVGMTKAPVFALIIGVVGCRYGMQVRGNAESLGLMTSRAVVTAIFAVIIADAVFSIFYAEVGL